MRRAEDGPPIALLFHTEAIMKTILISSLMIAGGAHADTVTGGTGAGGQYHASLDVVGRRFQQGALITKYKAIIAYGDGAKHYFGNATAGTASMKLSGHQGDSQTGSLPLNMDVTVPMKKIGPGGFRGTKTFEVMSQEPLAPDFTQSRLQFKAATGQEDSDYGKGYAGPKQ
jgi:hypothetical protein